METKLARIAELAKARPQEKFTEIGEARSAVSLGRNLTNFSINALSLNRASV